MKTTALETTSSLPNIPNAAIPHSNTLPTLGVELSIMGLALFGLVRQLISTKKSEWEANQALLEDFKETIKDKDKELEEAKDEILTLKAQAFRLQKQNKSYERAMYHSGFSEEVQPAESIN
jgi:hypothetical protein